MAQTKNENRSQRIFKIYYQYNLNVASINEGSTQFKRIITFNGSYGWELFYHTPGTAFFKEPKKDTDAGLLYNQKLDFYYPGEDEGNIENFINFAKPVIIKIVYTSGQMKIIGDKENPVKIYDDLNIGDKSGRNINIEHESIDPAFWLEEV